ncbi:MAG: hypothetical protein WA996_06025 [Candidatus Promineifilaceae bacterium]
MGEHPFPADLGYHGFIIAGAGESQGFDKAIRGQFVFQVGQALPAAVKKI